MILPSISPTPQLPATKIGASPARAIAGTARTIIDAPAIKDWRQRVDKTAIPQTRRPRNMFGLCVTGGALYGRERCAAITSHDLGRRIDARSRAGRVIGETARRD